MFHPLMTWTIYTHPNDLPDVPYVVRGWVITDGGALDSGAIGFADTLDEARRIIPEGLFNMGRQDDDDPVIVETWM